jgi:hypothetical protein
MIPTRRRRLRPLTPVPLSPRTHAAWLGAALQKGKGAKEEEAPPAAVNEEKVAGMVKMARVSAAALLEQLSKAYDDEHHRLDPADAKWLTTGTVPVTQPCESCESDG